MKSKRPKGKRVKGCDYAEEKEMYDKASNKKIANGMRTAGMAKELELSEKDMGYSKKPRVKPQSKTKNLVKGQKKVYK